LRLIATGHFLVLAPESHYHNLPFLAVLEMFPPHIDLCALMIVRSLAVLFTTTLFVTAIASAEVDFDKDVLPVFKTHCITCHGPEKQESGIRLDNLSTDLINDRAAAENWHEVLNVLKSGEMPPEDKPQLTVQQLQILTTWVSDAVQHAIESGRDTSGRVVLRRLNRLEYQNTMFDLLGLEMDYTRDLPPDSVSEDGFTNDGSSLNMSAMQLEYYLDTARRAFDRVIVSGEEPEVFDYTFTESKIDVWLGNAQRTTRLGRQQEFLSKMKDKYPEIGEFLVRVDMSAELKPGTGHPLLEVSVGYQPDTEILMRDFDLVEITSAEEQTLEFRGRLENFPLPVRGQGKYPGLVVRVRNRYDDGSPLPEEQTKDKRDYPEEPHLPTITVQSVEFLGPFFDQWPPASHRRILFESDQREREEAGYVAEVLRRFMTRAFRRPVQEHEVARLVDFHNSIRAEFPTLEETMRETLAMVLIQPDFLYHVEPAGSAKRPIDNSELASRLSYFLWSTMPDEPLTKLAAEGVLLEPKALKVEVNRMLNDPRSMRFVRQFTEQWLHLDYVDRVAVDREYYPRFDDSLKKHMREETQAFFAELIRSDLSAMNLLSSEFAMLNEPLAKHYGIEGVFGRAFRRVDLEVDSHRGGLLGQASILLSNSTGADSHVVRRAVWIRDRLLNDPPSPPPPDTPPLDKADPMFAKLSVREQLEIHRSREACASCHRGIDPWGIALENYDAVGLWRVEIRRKADGKFETLPVKASDVLPDHHNLDGPDSLKEYLVNQRKDEFAKSLVTRLATYALGRRMELSDQATIERLTNEFAANEYRIRGLIHNIVASELFLTK
jgi:mono/diheme cytochrome c family protein